MFDSNNHFSRVCGCCLKLDARIMKCVRSSQNVCLGLTYHQFSLLMGASTVTCLQPIKVFPSSEKKQLKRHHTHTDTDAQSAANCEALSLTFNTTPASGAAALLMPAAELGGSSLPTVQRFHRAALWCGRVHTQAPARTQLPPPGWL